MKWVDIKAAVKSGAENDLSISDTDITTWVNFAIDRINTACETNIPRLVTGVLDTFEPGFDARYHETLVLFAVGKYRESDGDYGAADYFINQFNDMLRDMQRDWEIPPSLKADYNHQQIVVTDGSKTSYDLSMPSGSYFDKVVVYKNDVEVDSNNYAISSLYKTITFVGITLAVNDKITIRFENNSDLNNAPYAWWGQSGW